MATKTRTEKIAALVAREIEKSNDLLSAALLPSIRKATAKALGGSPALYYGTVDPLYYRAVGLAFPLSVAAEKAETKAGDPSAAFRTALRRRRDEGGRLGRWDVLRASAEAVLGRRVSDAEAKALYARSGGDLDSSYVGRGTRVGAPATYEDASIALEGAASEA